MHAIAAKAVAFAEALRPDFKVYAKNVVENAKVLAESLRDGPEGQRIGEGAGTCHPSLRKGTLFYRAISARGHKLQLCLIRASKQSGGNRHRIWIAWQPTMSVGS
jgi:hypothetical protein